ncbi:hypothetical protein OAT67_06330 [Bacteriovoracaceae bacterium]|nr:hypothetical protein [Bacteriovoracaceae bacterium]
MKIVVLISLYFLSSCWKSENILVKLPEELPSSFQFITGKSSSIFIKRGDEFLNRKYGYKLDNNNIKKWLKELNTKTFENSKGAPIAGITPKKIILYYSGKALQFDGYKVNKNTCVVLSFLTEKKKPKKKSLNYIECSIFDLIFIDTDKLRTAKLNLNSWSNIKYINEKRNQSVNLTKEQSTQLLSLLNEFVTQSYVHSGEVNSSILRKYKINEKINNNITGKFSGKFNNKVLEIWFGRPERLTPLTRLYLSDELQIREGIYPQWIKLRSLYNEIIPILDQ